MNEVKWAEEMAAKGIETLEVNAEELRQMVIDGKITHDQMFKILCDNLGESKVNELLFDSFKDLIENEKKQRGTVPL